MWGFPMQVTLKDLVIYLRPMLKTELAGMLPKFNRASIHRWTMGQYAQSMASEEAWFDRVSNDTGSRHWAISVDMDSPPIGITGLHDISNVNMSASSGIIIWDEDMWGKGVATRAHLARTLVAANNLNLCTIKSSARVANGASRSALERVGYTTWGIEPRSHFREGGWLDTAQLVWFNPERVQLLYPQGIPDEFQKGIQRAKEALTLAHDVVAYL